MLLNIRLSIRCGVRVGNSHIGGCHSGWSHSGISVQEDKINREKERVSYHAEAVGQLHGHWRVMTEDSV